MEILKQESSDLSTNMSKSLNPYRDQVIEEISQHIEKMTVFGKDTVDSFAIYIRQLKNGSVENTDHKLLTIAIAALTDIATHKDVNFDHAKEARKALNVIKGIDK